MTTLHIYESDRKRWVRQKLSLDRDILVINRRRIHLQNSFIALGLPPTDPSLRLLPPNSFPFLIRGSNYTLRLYAKSSDQRQKWYLKFINNSKSTSKTVDQNKLESFERDLNSEGNIHVANIAKKNISPGYNVTKNISPGYNVTKNISPGYNVTKNISPGYNKERNSPDFNLSISQIQQHTPFFFPEPTRRLDLHESFEEQGGLGFLNSSVVEKRDEPLMEQSASWLAFINYGELQLLTLHKKSLILSDTFSGKLVFLLHCSNIVSVQKVHGRNFIKIVFFTVNKSGVKQYDDIVIVPLIEREKDDIVSAFMKIRGASKHSTMHGVSIIDVDGELSENHNPNKLKIRGDALITKWKLLILSHSNIVITQVEDAQKAFTHIANFAYTDIISFTIKGENCIISFSNGQSFVFRILPLTYDDTETLHNKASVLKTLLQSRVSFYHFLAPIFLSGDNMPAGYFELPEQSLQVEGLKTGKLYGKQEKKINVKKVKMETKAARETKATKNAREPKATEHKSTSKDTSIDEKGNEVNTTEEKDTRLCNNVLRTDALLCNVSVSSYVRGSILKTNDCPFEKDIMQFSPLIVNEIMSVYAKFAMCVNAFCASSTCVITMFE